MIQRMPLHIIQGPLSGFNLKHLLNFLVANQTIFRKIWALPD